MYSVFWVLNKDFNLCKVNPTPAQTGDHDEERGREAANTERTLQNTGLNPVNSHQNLQTPLPHTLNPSQTQNLFSFVSLFSSPLSFSQPLSILLLCHNMSRAAIYCQFIIYMFVYLNPSPHYSIEIGRDLVSNPSPNFGH